jgi:hypothetical protein
MSSTYADEGTVAHALAAMAITEGRPASAYINRVIKCDDYPHAKLSPSTAHRWMPCAGSNALETRIEFKPRSFQMTVTHEMAEGVQVYLDNLAKYMRGAPEGLIQVLVEQKLPVGHLTGEEGAHGSGDCVILDYAAYEIQVHDLKFGRGVEVVAQDNEQLRMYGLGALEQYAMLAPPGGWQRVRGVIHQPRLSSAPSEETWTVDELQRFANEVSECAGRCATAKETVGAIPSWADQYLVPGEKQCRFCDAKATCPAVEKLVVDSVLGDFLDLTGQPEPTPADRLATEVATVPAPDDLDRLAKLYAKKDLVIDWAKAIAAAFEARLLAGEKHPEWKCVNGRRGNRAWRDEREAEATLKSMRLKHDEMYEYSLISPTKAETLVQKVDKKGEVKPGEEAKPIGQRQWKKLIGLITQPPGSPTVVPVTDKRPALEVRPVTEDFTNLEEQPLV